MACATCLHSSMQVEDTLEHINDKRHLCTFSVNLQTIMQHKHTPSDTIGQTYAKILVSPLES